MRFCRLSRATGRLAPQTLDLAAWQRDADFPDPFQLYATDWLGVEAGQVDETCGFAALDGFQVALAGLQAHRGLFAVEARQWMTLLAVDHNDVAVFVFRQHGIAGHLKGNGFLRNREGHFNLAEALRRHLLVLRLDRGARADAAHDRHRVQLQIFDNGRDFRGLDQAQPRQNLRNRARAHAHRLRQTALGLARLPQSPLDHGDVQHGRYLFEFPKP